MPRTSIDAKNTLSSAIRAAREKANLSRAQVVEQVGIEGFTVAKLANIEIQRTPTVSEREALERVLGVTLPERGATLSDEPAAPVQPDIPATPPAPTVV